MFAYRWAESEDEIDEIDEFQQTTTPTWEDAACHDGQGSLTSLFFSDEIPDIELAKAICSTCPLIALCLRGALARREPAGVWGGQLFADGVVIPRKRKRGRPPKVAAALPNEPVFPVPNHPETVRRLEPARDPQEERKTA